MAFKLRCQLSFKVLTRAPVAVSSMEELPWRFPQRENSDFQKREQVDLLFVGGKERLLDSNIFGVSMLCYQQTTQPCTMLPCPSKKNGSEVANFQRCLQNRKLLWETTGSFEQQKSPLEVDIDHSFAPICKDPTGFV